MKNIAAGLGFAALVTFSTIGVAQAQEGRAENLRCPAPSLTSALTTKLPEGWSQPPITADLNGTLVANEGGTVSLVCRYGEAGAISRPMPPRFESCLPVEGGFDCALAR